MKPKTKQALADIGSGAAIGVACAIPGVSGGTLAVQLHVYDRHLGHMDNLRKHFWTNLVALLPLACGIIIGIIPAVILFQLAFKAFVFGIVSLFAGFIIGGLPSIFDEIKTEKPKTPYISILIGAFILAAGFGLISGLSKQFGFGIDLYANFNMVSSGADKGSWIDGGNVSWWVYLTLIPVGMLACVALIVPGISGSMILLVTGYYNPLLDTVVWWKEMFKGQASGAEIGSLFGAYACLLLGIVIGFLTIVRLMSFLFKKYRVATFYGILGFVVGSIFSLYYNYQIVEYYGNWSNGSGSTWLPMSAEIPVGIGLLIVGMVLSYLLVRFGRKNAQKPSENC